MYKLLIVDDEEVVIDGLLSAIDWDEHQIEIVGTAMDGNSAYQLIEKVKPNIVMADIRMPGLNGLDLIEKAKSLFPDIVFIIISGYTQFDYAKRAIELEAVDYLTKPIHLDKIIEAVKRATQKYDKLIERKEAILKLGQYKSQVEEKEIIQSLLGKQIDREWFIESNMSCTVLVTDRKYKATNDKLLDSMKFHFKQEEYHRIFTCEMEEHLVTVCFIFGISEEVFLKHLNVLFQKGVNRHITGISRTHTKITTLQNLYKEAIEAFHIGLYLQQEVTYYHDLENMNDTIGMSIIRRVDQFFLQRKIDLSSSMILIDELVEYSTKEKLTPVRSKYLCFKFINHIFEYAHQEFDVNVEAVLQEEKYLIYKQLNQLRTMDEHKEWLIQKISKLLCYLSDNQLSEKEKLMFDVKNYVKENYNHGIGLDEIAEKFHISPAYLSTLFSKKAGVTLFEYIINMRMEKAKELLRTTNYKISEICQQVGYEHQRYFNQVFKKHIGCTPGTYRSNHLVKHFK